jgi:hypothetical protein
MRNMHLAVIGSTAMLLASATVQGQTAGPSPTPAPALPTCPASGFAKPLYGGFGDNDGVIRGYQIASPCIAKETLAAAEALGMARGKPVGIFNISTIRFGATGTLAEDNGRPAPRADVDIAISYAIPAIRLTVRGTSAESPQSGWVFADGKVWNEDAPGVNGRKAPASAIGARAPLPLLTPFGAVQAIAEAEGHATVSTVDGRTVLSGTSPYDRLPVKVTLGEKNLPVAVEVVSGRNVYRATFEDYRDDFEPPYLVVFPAKITWTLNGRPYADLTVTRFKSNPYVIFPAPAAAK